MEGAFLDRLVLSFLENLHIGARRAFCPGKRPEFLATNILICSMLACQLSIASKMLPVKLPVLSIVKFDSAHWAERMDKKFQSFVVSFTSMMS